MATDWANGPARAPLCAPAATFWPMPPPKQRLVGPAWWLSSTTVATVPVPLGGIGPLHDHFIAFHFFVAHIVAVKHEVNVREARRGQCGGAERKLGRPLYRMHPSSKARSALSHLRQPA